MHNLLNQMANYTTGTPSDNAMSYSWRCVSEGLVIFEALRYYSYDCVLNKQDMHHKSARYNTSH